MGLPPLAGGLSKKVKEPFGCSQRVSLLALLGGIGNHRTPLDERGSSACAAELQAPRPRL